MKQKSIYILVFHVVLGALRIMFIHKDQKLTRAIESWIMEHKYEREWQIDVIAVKLVLKDKYASVKYLPNIIL